MSNAEYREAVELWAKDMRAGDPPREPRSQRRRFRYKARLWYTECDDCRAGAIALFGAGSCIRCLDCGFLSGHKWTRRARRQWKKDHDHYHDDHAAREAAFGARSTERSS